MRKNDSKIKNKNLTNEQRAQQMIPVNEPLLGSREVEYVTDCVKSGWVSSAGHYLEQFEEEWARFCGRKYGLAVSNGTAALHLAVAALGLEPDDEVILPSFTIISCAAAIVYNNAVPVLVDADPQTWCMNVHQIREKITKKTRAIMPVHIYGHPVDMDPLLEIADEFNLAVIEDAAEAHGAEYLSRRNDTERWRRCGSFGTMSCFSFYANKLVTTGEGGMIVTDNSEHADKLRSLRNLCFQPQRRFFHEELGYNFRLTNLQAALGLAQVERIQQIIQKKRNMAKKYTEGLDEINCLQLSGEQPWARSVFWMYGLVLNERHRMNAAEFSIQLRNRGVETRPFFLGMHEQPALKNRGLFNGEHYPVTDNLSYRGLYLPSGLALKNDQIDTVIDAVKQVLQ
jgi:perosamine synthetase